MTALSNQCNTIALLNGEIDAIHILLHNCFRLLKPVRRKYKLSVNACLVLNGVYLYHKFKGSIFSVYGIYKMIGYYNRNRLVYYIGYLVDKDYLCRAEVIKKIQYYKITDKGLQVMNEFYTGYQSILFKWCESKEISL